MAIIDSKGRLHGKLGPHVYRTIGDRSIVQSRAAKVRQTLSTRESALEFGMASNAARILRWAFLPLTYTADGGMINRMNVAVLKCIKDSREKKRGERDLHDGDLGNLAGFQFNKNSPLGDLLKVRPVAELDADSRLKVRVPAFKEAGDLQSIPYSHYCVLRLILVAVNFRENYYEYGGHLDIRIGRGRVFEGQEWQPEAILPAGCIAMVSVSLHYFGAAGMLDEAPGLNSTDMGPAELLAAFKIPAVEESTDIPETEKAMDGEIKRFPLTNNRSGELLRELTRIKKLKEKKYGHMTGDKAREIKDTTFSLPLGKVYVQKE